MVSPFLNYCHLHFQTDYGISDLCLNVCKYWKPKVRWFLFLLWLSGSSPIFPISLSLTWDYFAKQILRATDKIIAAQRVVLSSAKPYPGPQKWPKFYVVYLLECWSTPYLNSSVLCTPKLFSSKVNLPLVPWEETSKEDLTLDLPGSAKVLWISAWSRELLLVVPYSFWHLFQCRIFF